MTKATEVQQGGKHYKEMVIQPVEYITANDLSWCEGNVVKYISRHGAKGELEDIKKVIHYALLLAELEYNATPEDLGIDYVSGD